MTRQPYLLPALLVLTLARYMALDTIPLSEIEKYTLRCAADFDFWHPSLGPILPLITKATTAVFGENVWGVRCLSPLIILGSSILLWNLCLGLFDATTAAWSVVVLNVVPAVNVAAITLTPTTFGIATSIIVLCTLRVALHSQHPWHQPWWLLGLSFVVAFMIDWRLLMLSVAAGMTMLLSGRGRRALLRWPVVPILAGCLGFALTLFIAWNTDHHWSGLKPFLEKTSLMEVAIQLGVLLSPLLLPAFAWAYASASRKKPMGYAIGMLGAFSLPMIMLDALSWSQLPWPCAAYSGWIAPASALLAHQMLNADMLRPRFMLTVRCIVLGSAAILSCAVVHGGLLRSLGLIAH